MEPGLPSQQLGLSLMSGLEGVVAEPELLEQRVLKALLDPPVLRGLRVQQGEAAEEIH
jgi:hypothetical protein